MRVFLTGATGGIGSFVGIDLLSEGFEVAALVRKESLNKLDSRIKPILGDLRSINDIASQLTDFQPSTVVHLGWIGVDKTQKENLSQFQNLMAASTLLKISRSCGVKTFIGMGSEAEYGIQNKKLSEEDPTLPITEYGLAKLATGLLAQKICADSDIRYVWLRLFSSYGPNDRSGSLMSILIKTLRDKKPMPLSGCEQIWDYVHVKDISKLISIIVKDPKEGEIFNLGGGQAQPLKNLVTEIAGMIDPNAKLRFGAIPYSPNQLMHLEADISKLKKTYNWSPSISLDEGLRETVRFHSQ